MIQAIHEFRLSVAKGGKVELDSGYHGKERYYKFCPAHKH
jgi:hypothetical protein